MLVGSAAAWPLAARSQQAERMRRIGVPMAYAESNPIGQSEVAAFRKALQELGWKDGDNLQIDVRWGANNLDLERKYATELVVLTPDTILAFGTLSVAALQRASSTVPIVFVGVQDPVGAGLVERSRGRWKGGTRPALSGSWYFMAGSSRRRARALW